MCYVKYVEYKRWMWATKRADCILLLTDCDVNAQYIFFFFFSFMILIRCYIVTVCDVDDDIKKRKARE